MSDEFDDGPVLQGVALDLSQRAQVLLERGRYHEALRFIGDALGQDPGDASLYCQLCFAHQGLNQNEKAEQAARRALALQPECDLAMRCLCTLALGKGAFGEALHYARAAAQIDPDHADNLIWLARADAEHGHYRRAFQAANRAVQLYPDDVDTHVLLGDLSMQRHRFGKAQTHYRRALRFLPDNAHLHFLLGDCLYLHNCHVQAAEHLLTAVKADPAEPLYKQRLLSAVKDYTGLLGGKKVDGILADFPAPVRVFYHEEMQSVDRINRMSMGRMAAIWLVVIAGLAVLINAINGQSNRSLLSLVLVILVGSGLYQWYAKHRRRVVNKRNRTKKMGRLRGRPIIRSAEGAGRDPYACKYEPPATGRS